MSSDKKPESNIILVQLEEKVRFLIVFMLNTYTSSGELPQSIRDALTGGPQEISFGEDVSVGSFALLRKQIDDQTPSFLDMDDPISRNKFLMIAKLKAQLSCLESACRSGTDSFEYLSVVNILMERAKALAQQIPEGLKAIQKASLNDTDEDANNNAKHLIGICNQLYGHFREELSKNYTSPIAKFISELVNQFFSPFEKAVSDYYDLSQEIVTENVQVGVQDKKSSAEDADFIIFQKYIQEKLQDVRRISEVVMPLQVSGKLDAKKLEEFKKDIRECINEAAEKYEGYLKNVTGVAAWRLEPKTIYRIDEGRVSSTYGHFRREAENYLAKLDKSADKNNAQGGQISNLTSSSAFLSLSNPDRPPTPPKDKNTSITPRTPSLQDPDPPAPGSRGPSIPGGGNG